MADTTIERIKKFAEGFFVTNKDSAHNMDHVMRVYHMACKLVENEDADLEVIEIAALLHDIGGEKEIQDTTGRTDHSIESVKLAEPFLRKLKISEAKIKHITDCIISHRYRTENKPQTLEAKVLFDADKLEIVGAIGIARAYTWIGKHNAHIYKKVNIKQYTKENQGGKINGKIQDKTKHSPQINWETKDKLILDFLYTKKAKKIAQKRLAFSEMFFEKLEKEIEGLE